MGLYKTTDSQLDLFSINTRNIPIKYINCKTYLFVRKVKPEKKHGAKALKNEDFKDHDYWPYMYAYSAQVTNRLMNERYIAWQKEIAKKSKQDKKLLQDKINGEMTGYGYSPTLEKIKRHSMSHDYTISFEMPEKLDQYKQEISYKNYETKDMYIEVSFQGPLDYPRLENNTVHSFIGLSCVIPADHEIVVDMYSHEVIGNSLLKYINDSSFWAIVPGDNELAIEADHGIDGGYVRIQTRYEMNNAQT
jgi:hypothetical protein